MIQANHSHFTQAFTQGDAIDTTGPDIGDVSAYGDQLSTAAGTVDTLAGTVTSQGALTVTLVEQVQQPQDSL